MEAYPIEGHVSGIFEDVVIRVSHDSNVSSTFSALWTQCLQRMLGMGGIAAYGSLHFLIHDHIDLNTSFCPSLQDLVQPPFLVVIRGPPQEQLWAEPPILNVDGLLRPLQCDANSPEIISTIHIPLDHVAVMLGCKALESVALGNFAPLLIGPLLVRFIVAMVGIEDVFELAKLVLQMVRLDLGIVEVGFFELFAEPAKKFVLAGGMVFGGGGLTGSEAGNASHDAWDGFSWTQWRTER